MSGRDWRRTAAPSFRDELGTTRRGAEAAATGSRTRAARRRHGHLHDRRRRLCSLPRRVVAFSLCLFVNVLLHATMLARMPLGKHTVVIRRLLSSMMNPSTWAISSASTSAARWLQTAPPRPATGHRFVECSLNRRLRRAAMFTASEHGWIEKPNVLLRNS